MKNIVKLIILIAVSSLVFTACHKEEDLPLYLAGNGTVVSVSTPAVTAVVADSNKTVLTVNWTWPNYATDSINQKFIVQIDSAGHNFAKPVTKTVKGVTSTSFTAKELNNIVFGFGDINKPYTLQMRVVSSYSNNNEQYTSNNVSVVVTPYIIPVTLTVTPPGPLTLVVGNATQTAVVFRWNATQYGNVPLNYSVQIDKAGGTWATPTVLKFGTATTGSITVNDLNNAAINAGIAPDATGDLSIRVVATQGAYPGTNPLYSNVATLKVTTYLSVMTWYVPGNYVAASYPGSGMKDWDPATSPIVKSLSSAPTKLEGYVYMSGATNEWKFASKPNWDGPNYGAGATAGSLDAAGGNMNSPKGFYKLNVDAAALTYTAVATTWGVIGSATPGAWADQTNMTYIPESKIFALGLSMPLGEFKFRGTPSWSVNYGCTKKDGKTLDADGSNIAVALAADYAITLDLSVPNAYTYSANFWGIIGAATAGGWDSDQNMTWDATNKVFTATIPLTAGEFKFRANDAWSVNFGGTLDALVQDGPNLSVAVAGSYKITLDPWARKATVTKL